MSEFRSKPNPMPSTRKHRTLSSADARREAIWRKRKEAFRRQASDGQPQATTEADMDELKGCIELGFAFDTSNVHPKLAEVLPGLKFMCKVDKMLKDSQVKASSSAVAPVPDASGNDGATPSCDEDPDSIFKKGDDPNTVKEKIRLWAKAVACLAMQKLPLA